MSKIEVDTIDTVTGTSTLQVGSTNTSTINLGASGDTINIPSGATFNVNGTVGTISGQNYPAFEAYKTANQSVTHNAVTKVQFETESFDTDNCYDNSTNYRFTPTVAGKYFVYTELLTDSQLSSNLNTQNLYLYKNGGIYKHTINQFNANPVRQTQVVASATIDMNGSSDYLEVYVQIGTANSGNGIVEGAGAIYERASIFGAYRIGS